MRYDLIIVGAGPGGIFSAYELSKLRPNLKILMLETGNPLNRRKCPIDGKKIKSCISCKSCAIMNGFGGAGAFSDGKYNITNEFGGDLYEYVGKKEALDLMNYVDEINLAYGGQNTRKFTTANSDLKRECLQHDLHLLDASVRHLGTDINYVILENLYEHLKDKVEMKFNTYVSGIDTIDGGYVVKTNNEEFEATEVIVATGRSGSKWMQSICSHLGINTKSNRVDIGVRVEIPAAVFEHITSKVYESKIVYRTKKYQDKVRTFCMNPHGVVVMKIQMVLLQ